MNDITMGSQPYTNIRANIINTFIAITVQPVDIISEPGCHIFEKEKKTIWNIINISGHHSVTRYVMQTCFCKFVSFPLMKLCSRFDLLTVCMHGYSDVLQQS